MILKLKIKCVYIMHLVPNEGQHYRNLTGLIQLVVLTVYVC